MVNSHCAEGVGSMTLKNEEYADPIDIKSDTDLVAVPAQNNEKSKSMLEKLGVLYQRRRSEQGLSQWQLAEKASVNRTYLSDIERGVCNATVSVLTRLAAALDTKLWIIL